jgi:hypothetical protein
MLPGDSSSTVKTLEKQYMTAQLAKAGKPRPKAIERSLVTLRSAVRFCPGRQCMK